MRCDHSPCLFLPLGAACFLSCLLLLPGCGSSKEEAAKLKGVKSGLGPFSTEQVML
jgi:hypothetical protein